MSNEIQSMGTVPTWIGTAVTLAAPTAAELNAFTEITDILAFPPEWPDSADTIDIPNSSSTRHLKMRGMHGGDSIILTYYRRTTGDTAYDTLTRTYDGFVALAYDGIATPGTWAVSDVVWLAEIQVINRPISGTGNNQAQMVVAELVVVSDPTEKYTIAT